MLLFINEAIAKDSPISILTDTVSFRTNEPTSGVCDVKSFKTDIFASAAINDTNSVKTGTSSLSNQANVPDANATNFASMSASFLIIGSSSAYVSVKTNGTVLPIGSVVGAVADVSGSGTVKIRTYLAGTPQEDITPSTGTTYYAGHTNYTFTSTKTFDEIQFYISSSGLIIGSIS